jgi:hypothetical protein
MVAGGGGGGRDEKIALGVVRLNLSEYVEESEGISRESTQEKRHIRKRSNAPSTSSRSSFKIDAGTDEDNDEDGDEVGIVRRYLMSESKVNSTLKIGILMVQIDGDRNYIAPALKTAPVFGGIAGIMAGEPVESDDAGRKKSPAVLQHIHASFTNRSSELPNINKSRDAAEVQDVYRSALTASWAGQPGELTADECIEDIFSGGDGWKAGSGKSHRKGSIADEEDSGSLSGDEGIGGTLRPADLRRMHLSRSHRRDMSGASEKSVMTVTARDDAGSSSRSSIAHRRNMSKDGLGDSRSRSESLTSLTPTMGSSDRGREHGFKRAREVDEFEMRDDMVAWRLPGAAT